jgi:hypothetical protein
MKPAQIGAAYNDPDKGQGRQRQEQVGPTQFEVRHLPSGRCPFDVTASEGVLQERPMLSSAR